MSATVETNGALAVRRPADIEAPITAGEVNTLYRLAHTLARSNFFRDAHDANKAFAKLLFGRDLGLSATQALTDIHIVEGKPEMSANLHAAKVRSSGVYDYRVLALEDTICEIEFGPAPAPGRSGDGTWLLWPQSFGTSRFTMDDAARAGLTRPRASGALSNYDKFGRNMLFARAMTNGTAWYCPDVMNGIRVYAEGEIPTPTADPPHAEPAAAHADPEQKPDDRKSMVDALANGVNRARWDDDRLAMELIDLGIDDVTDPLGALAQLSPEQGEQLNQKLSAEIDNDGDGKEAGGGDD